MSTDAPKSRPTRYSSVCWVSSIAIHGVVVGAAMALVSDLTLPPSHEKFTWEVAVVEKPAPPEPAVPAPPPVAPTPPEPQAVKTPAPAKPRPMRQESVVQKTEPVQEKRPVEAPQPMQEVQPVQELQSVKETQPVQEVQQPQEIQSVKEAQPVQEARLQKALQPVQQAAHEQVTAITRPVQEATQPAREVTQSVLRSDAPVESAESVERSLQTVQPLMRGEHVEAAVVQDHAVASVPSYTQHTTMQESQVSVETAPKVEQTVTARHTPAVQQRTLQHMPVRARPTARPDYGWLAQALFANMDQRKRYPLEAKLNRLEGKVVLRLTIEQRGTSVYLLDMALEESSGHAILDRHTQEVVRKAFPIQVKHVLSQPQIQLDLPFSYSVE